MIPEIYPEPIYFFFYDGSFLISFSFCA